MMNVVVSLTDVIVRSAGVIVRLIDIIVYLTDVIVSLSDAIVRLTVAIVRLSDVIVQLMDCSVLWLCARAGSVGAMAKVESDEMGLKLTCVEKWLNSAAGGMCGAIESIDKMTVRWLGVDRLLSAVKIIKVF